MVLQRALVATEHRFLEQGQRRWICSPPGTLLLDMPKTTTHRAPPSALQKRLTHSANLILPARALKL